MPAAIVSLMLLGACGAGNESGSGGSAAGLGSVEPMAGFVDLYWDETGGRMILGIHETDTPFIYQTSLARGVGSNDLGLDRGQLGQTAIAEFRRVGPKVLLVQQNLDYRARSDSPAEARAVEESFAASVLWGFDLLEERDNALLVDATDFLLRDSHGIGARLREADEGDYSVEVSRSAVYLPRSRAFPDNTEVEAIVTLKGQPAGKILRTVVPDPTTLSVHLHHSFIRAPDDNYEPLPYDPRAGIIGLAYGSDGFFDYATPVGDALTVAYGRRHRLEKKDPSAEQSEAVEPIVYYVDRGAPEPIRSALIEGASWWNAAFEAAGYVDAFRVELLPEDADPMDVRYNVIQWVHRSTRGWSYGSSIVDPRTGEILKGHVTLGSLRVRQDFLIAEGLLAPYGGETTSEAMLGMSLARLRQLSAHEVGHTIGMEHNFAASTQGRSSVMDYPAPFARLDDEGSIDLSDAYGVDIGAWDHRTVLYAYQDFPDDVDADAERANIMAETMAQGLKYVSDDDSRAVGTAHPDGNLWDNGADALAELERLLAVREKALANFSAANIRPGRPLATLEEVLVPIYLLHRYQVEAVGKLIGGYRFSYALRGDGQDPPEAVEGFRQRSAMRALVRTLDPELLRLPDALLDAIPPRPPGHALGRETFPRNTGKTFDPLGPAKSAAALTLDVLLDPERAARMSAGHGLDPELPGFGELTAALLAGTWYAERADGGSGELQRAAGHEVLVRMLLLAADTDADTQVRAQALDAINGLDNWLARRDERDAAWRAHDALARLTIARFRDDPASVEQLQPATAPPGSPI